MVTQAHVDDALGCATSQGYKFTGWSAEDIALDLIAYDAEVENATPEELLPFVRDWQSRTGA